MDWPEVEEKSGKSGRCFGGSAAEILRPSSAVNSHTNESLRWGDMCGITYKLVVIIHDHSSNVDVSSLYNFDFNFRTMLFIQHEVCQAEQNNHEQTLISARRARVWKRKRKHQVVTEMLLSEDRPL